jgi:hypothetical protein
MSVFPRSNWVAAVGAIAAALALSGCGSSGSSSTSTTSTAAASGHPTQAQLHAVVSFAHCMRSHGVPAFPDPTSSPHDFKFALSPSSGNASSPAFRAALGTCQHLLPDGGPSSESPARRQAQIAAGLAFARCVRAHGFPNFPDPTSTGELTPEMVTRAGIDIHQPAAIHAADACVGVTHGFLTRADIARAVNGPG